MQRPWHFALVMLVACGARLADDGASDGGADAKSDAAYHADGSAELDASSDAHAATDAQTSVDGSFVDLDAGTPPTPVCTAGSYWVSVVDDAGAHVFDGGCDDGGIPDGVYASCGMKIICGSISACDATGSIHIVGLVPGVPGSSFADIAYAAEPDASVNYDGKMTLADWPQPGGTVSGSFATRVDGGPSVSGTFCVLRR